MPGAVRRSSAQSLQAQSEGVRAGPFLLYPSLVLDWTYDSNVLYRSSDLGQEGTVPSRVWAARPRLMVDLPMGESRLTFAYSPLFRRYLGDQFKTSADPGHFFDLEGTFRVGPSLRLAVRDHYVQATSELANAGAASDVAFGLVAYATHEPELEATVDIGPRQGFSLLPRYSSLHFDEGGPSFYSYERKGVEGRYNYRVSPTSVLYAYYDRNSIQQQRSTGSPDVSDEGVGLGVRRVVNNIITTRVTAGHRSLVFKDTPGSDYSGPTLEAALALDLSALAKIDVEVARQPYQSFYVNNNYYVYHQVRLLFTQQIGRRFYWRAGGSLEWNRYADPIDIAGFPGFDSLAPSQGIVRRDDVERLEARIAHRFKAGVVGFIGYNYEVRKSNIEQFDPLSGGLFDPFDYTVERVFLGVQVGWW